MFYSVGHVKLCEQIATYSSTPCNKHVYGIALTEENKLYCSKVKTALSSKQLFHSRERIYLKNLFQKWAVSVSYLEHALNFTSLVYWLLMFSRITKYISLLYKLFRAAQ